MVAADGLARARRRQRGARQAGRPPRGVGRRRAGGPGGRGRAKRCRQDHAAPGDGGAGPGPVRCGPRDGARPGARAAPRDRARAEHVLLWVRIPRVLASLLVGGALAGAGCALQALLRNPLAEPFTLGISSGSALAAVIAIRIGAEGALGGAGVSAAALAGASVTLLVVWQLGRIGRQLPPATLVLAGVTMSMFCASVGGLDSMRLGTVGYATPPILGGLAVLAAHGRELNALAAGAEAAASVGVAVARTQTVIFVVASLLVGSAIAVAGPIGFIGLVVPHALRAVIGPDHRLLLPASVLGGAAVLAVCDTLARTALAPAQLPTGAVTAVLGVPFFVVILLRHKHRAAMWGR
ncbi:MAG TPA: iron ABC transporter permease [Kofleriaceae bacterium]|nr:iron ABC transporter permease [Kofleriaceae bacterium]